MLCCTIALITLLSLYIHISIYPFRLRAPWGSGTMSYHCTLHPVSPHSSKNHSSSAEFLPSLQVMTMVFPLLGRLRALKQVIVIVGPKHDWLTANIVPLRAKKMHIVLESGNKPSSMKHRMLVRVALQEATALHSQLGCKIHSCFPSLTLTLSPWSRDPQIDICGNGKHC